jgi:hypothetical protein
LAVFRSSGIDSLKHPEFIEALQLIDAGGCLARIIVVFWGMTTRIQESQIRMSSQLKLYIS